ncbi:galactoside 3-L-fucosyltransferase [Raphidocelis subcapitata]|uniref:Fucosyltransferase n=1 Tax=Raphidocelis subcapitata TaxID=307507 RepID=A0A2V0PKV8_9CHLO|nr:galactoside 3-L-fucosyltransferase [Raphidocelis subcapitata]|eukprot:GBF98653.1 galactoside 3-L-fucosyltransferase [Raphidocelis subcapitata]
MGRSVARSWSPPSTPTSCGAPVDPGANERYPLAREVPGCTYQGHPLPCRYVSHPDEAAAAAAGADATIWHAPTGCWAPRRPPGSKHLRVVASTESSVYYNCLDDPGFMSQFDVEMTYRLCSQVPLLYFVDRYASLAPDGLLRPPLPFAEKLDALAVVVSNCQGEGAFSGRARVLREVARLAEARGARVRVLSYGRCDTNAPFPPELGGDKVALLARHKFCCAMENSIAQDYVTEKLWDALTAGCVPVYLGAPNAADFLPSEGAAILYGAGAIRTPEDLLDEMERLAGDEAAYAAKLAWKLAGQRWGGGEAGGGGGGEPAPGLARPEEDFGPRFRAFLAQTELHRPHAQCQLCQLVAAHRARPRRYTTCLWNETWLAAARRLPPLPAVGLGSE